ncbi:hypothetical protein BGW36DRAFT_431828 [Talaromyces proteolyticus]|uniref:Carboxymuconolactone decarboxylase-like domain-containing protein n=1 Tax=Talaromyces proteolyticus TaxID=1131652 RepID=A0AAD4KM37_9EURO|nr:uncharacterized protein BGW36DRAFT_431828 [Talaromyces proteolyticus]KAH8691275.1 hypothetical protein BGW36DRAFT_431828 [Talaromyces proteolyticus]
MSDFERKYITANNPPNTPVYDEMFFQNLFRELNTISPELEPISISILASLAIGAHRPDLVSCILDRAIAKNQQNLELSFKQLEGVIMVVWPFVGIPWCVTACLGIVNVLEGHNFLEVADKVRRPSLNSGHKQIGEDLMLETYKTVRNEEVRDMLRQYFPDFSSLTWTVVFGYCLNETTETGVFNEAQSELILACCLTTSGATRQATSHLKASISLGNSVDSVRAVLKVAAMLVSWNGQVFNPLDINAICS